MTDTTDTQPTDAERRIAIHAAIRRGFESVFAGSAPRDVVRAAADQVLALPTTSPVLPTREALTAYLANGALAQVADEYGRGSIEEVADAVLALLNGETR